MTRLDRLYGNADTPFEVLQAVGPEEAEDLKFFFWQSFMDVVDDWLWGLDSEARGRLGTLDPSDCETIAKLRDALR